MTRELNKEERKSRSLGGASLLRQTNALNKSYERVLNVLKIKGLVPLFNREDWRGMTDGSKARYYDVMCTCGCEFKTWFSGMNCSKCPECSKGAVNSKYTRYLRALLHCKNADVTPLFTKEEYTRIGTVENNRLRTYRVRCNKCNTEFQSGISANSFYNCPGCGEGKCNGNGYESAKRHCAQSLLTLLVSEEEYRGTNERKIDGKGGLAVFYPVRCDVCGTEYKSIINGSIITSCPYCKNTNYRSNRERLIGELLRENNLKVLFNYRGEFKNPETGRALELDLYLPDKKIAFEFNGYYFHNSTQKPIHYHETKTKVCLDQGIRLYHIWEDMSDNLVKSIIKSKLGLNKRIYARKCKVLNRVPDGFFDLYHEAKDCRIDRAWGLYQNEECLAAISLRYTKSGEPEIARFCTKFGITVVGGYSKLLKAMTNHLKSLNYDKLITYCNRDLSPDPMNNFYASQNMNFAGNCSLILKYWVSRSIDFGGRHYKQGDVVPRQRFQKYKIIEYYNSNGMFFDGNSTEIELAKDIGLYAVFNSGNFKYEFKF